MTAMDHHGKREDFVKTAAVTAGIAILAVAEWTCHRKLPFMMDDLWYATNLSTSQPLRGLADVVESQIWHFLNWGGRCVTHGVLQLTLMSGELAADILNMAATLLLSLMICVTAGWRKPFGFLCASSLIVALNANVKMSMFWQAGCANYVYSSVWILLFLWPYLRQAEAPDGRPLPLVSLWIWPLGLMAGWSNENMGPSCFVLAVSVCAYLAGKQKKCLCQWMIFGAVSSLAGSVLVVAAPGNFVRASAIEKMPLGTFLYDRFFSMLRAGTDYLFPAAALSGVLLLFWTICLREKLRPAQCLLLLLAFLSYGAMVLSPHYPDRATFGTMVACIALSLSLMQGILNKRPDLGTYMGGIAFCYWSYAVYLLYTM